MKLLVIPSEVEGSRCETFKVTSAGSFDSASLRSGWPQSA